MPFIFLSGLDRLPYKNCTPNLFIDGILIHVHEAMNTRRRMVIAHTVQSRTLNCIFYKVKTQRCGDREEEVEETVQNEEMSQKKG